MATMIVLVSVIILTFIVKTKPSSHKTKKPAAKSKKSGWISWKIILVATLVVAAICAVLYFMFPNLIPSVLTMVKELFEFMLEQWVWTLILLGITLFIIMKRFSPSKSQTKPYASTGVGGAVESVVGGAIVSVSMAIYFSIVVSGIVLVIACVVAFVNWYTDYELDHLVESGVAVYNGEPLPERTVSGAECDFADKLDARRSKLPTQWMPVTICKNDNSFAFFVPVGTEPEIEFRDQSDRVLNSRHVSDFVVVESMYGKIGGMPNMYRLSIPEHNGFTDTSFDAVEFAVRATSNVVAQPTYTAPSSTIKSASVGSCDQWMLKDLQQAGAQRCRKITFDKIEKYDFVGTPGTCPRFNPSDAGTQTRIAGAQYTFVPASAGKSVHFYELPIGKSAHGYTCS